MKVQTCGLFLLCLGVVHAGNEEIVPADNNNDWDPGTWHLIDGKYYFADRYSEQIYTARTYCQRVGMIPVTFEDPAKKVVLDAYFTNIGWTFYDFWTGAVKRKGSNAYIWEPSGIPFDVSQWAPGQPKYASDTRDVCIRYSPGTEGFSDWVCDITYPNWGHILCQEP
ncbi:uncharacterized protein LOC132200684 [Neocloeon triangulifer]|uniref:uncharacterized protein LOC132200684 n=1 Tax=Neocloeon triangulifer TaxID=2078957 RepID=UPI00286F0E36|nr:uncharacterized protein LOC132200684 [Neocloeon triangulifer]